MNQLNKKLLLNKKMFYITIIIMFVFIIILSVSFAFIQKQVVGAAVNLKVGQLEYTLECDELINRQITLAEKTVNNLNISITNTSSIDFKYELYYKIITPISSSLNIEGGYLSSAEILPSGIIEHDETKDILISLVNYDSEEITIEIGLKTGLVYNDLEYSVDEVSFNKIISTTYQIVYDANGGSGGPTTDLKKSETTLVLSDEIPTKSGYNFLGWSIYETAEEATYIAGSNFEIDSDTTLYAVWEKSEYILTVNPNGGTWNSSTSSQMFTLSTNATKSISVPSRYGYTFKTWNLSGTGSTMSSLTAASTFTMGTSNATLTANWTMSGEQARATSQELTSKTGGNFFPYATIKTNTSAFTYSSGRLYCQTAGTYTIRLSANSTYSGTDNWHGTVYVNKIAKFSVYDGKTGSQSVTLAVGDYIYCNSSASQYENGYLTLVITK